METIRFYNWLINNEIECHSYGDDDLICFIGFDELKQFVAFFFIEVEDEFRVNLQDSCICVEMLSICNSVGINVMELRTLLSSN